jgi:hypothetical protein
VTRLADGEHRKIGALVVATRALRITTQHRVVWRRRVFGTAGRGGHPETATSASAFTIPAIRLSCAMHDSC